MKLMIKVLAVFVAAIALMVFVLRDTVFDAPNLAGKRVAIASFERVASLPGDINESSGIIVLPKTGYYLTHNDAGNRPYLYKLDKSGKVVSVIKLKLPNVDWEDITRDDKGYVYIADSGNNSNRRKQMAVYKVNIENPDQIEAIRYTYTDQKEYPPSKKDWNFDSEAIFWANGSLYLISKDRGRGETAKIYKLPDKGGTYQAKLTGQHKLKAQVTGADISPDGNTVVLLSEEKIHFFTEFDSSEEFYTGQYRSQKLKGAGQTEGIAFEDDQTLVITSEGGNLYRFKL